MKVGDYVRTPFGITRIKENVHLLDSEYDKLAHSEEDKKIPEKLNLDTDELRGKETPRTIDYLIEDKINEVIDYLKSKGE